MRSCQRLRSQPERPACRMHILARLFFHELIVRLFVCVPPALWPPSRAYRSAPSTGLELVLAGMEFHSCWPRRMLWPTSQSLPPASQIQRVRKKDRPKETSHNLFGRIGRDGPGGANRFETCHLYPHHTANCRLTYMRQSCHTDKAGFSPARSSFSSANAGVQKLK